MCLGLAQIYPNGKIDNILNVDLDDLTTLYSIFFYFKSSNVSFDQVWPKSKHWFCNTLNFALFKIDENLFSFVFCAHENIRKIIFFIKLKFIISLSNIVVHTCWRIRFDVMFACCSFMCWVSKVFKNVFSRSIFLYRYVFIFIYNQIPCFYAQVFIRSFLKYFLLCKSFLLVSLSSSSLYKLFRNFPASVLTFL